jgi:hypothetical protein
MLSIGALVPVAFGVAVLQPAFTSGIKLPAVSIVGSGNSVINKYSVTNLQVAVTDGGDDEEAARIGFQTDEDKRAISGVQFDLAPNGGGAVASTVKVKLAGSAAFVPCSGGGGGSSGSGGAGVLVVGFSANGFPAITIDFGVPGAAQSPASTGVSTHWACSFPTPVPVKSAGALRIIAVQ